MESLTRRRVGAAELTTMVIRAFGPRIRVAASREPTAGPARRRPALYRTYLFLIMAIEGRTRDWADRARPAEPLERQLALLAAGQPGR